VLLYPEGTSLAALLKRQGGALSEAQVASYGYQLSGLLAQLAGQRPPLVHGSITPATIWLSHDLRLVTLMHLPLFTPVSQAHHTEHGAAGYAAPEQSRSGEITSSSDLYSVAVCMHQAVTGYDPHTRLALFHPPARRLNPAVTPQMELILTRQLSLSPSQRYACPDEMQRALATLLESYPELPGGEPSPQDVDPLNLSATQLRERSKSALLLNMGVFAAMCALLLIGLILFLLRV
jgi:serine/threonine protein kinase